MPSRSRIRPPPRVESSFCCTPMRNASIRLLGEFLVTSPERVCTRPTSTVPFIYYYYFKHKTSSVASARVRSRPISIATSSQHSNANFVRVSKGVRFMKSCIWFTSFKTHAISFIIIIVRLVDIRRRT
jgi:hypothetical protein